jgi:hypothetical protein
MDIQKLLQKAYCWDFDHILDHRDGLDMVDDEDDLDWPDDFVRQMEEVA